MATNASTAKWIQLWRFGLCLIGLFLAVTAAVLHDLFKPDEFTMGYL